MNMLKKHKKGKLFTMETMVEERERLWRKRRKLVLVNGCFDLLHAGHVEFLEFARQQGHALLVVLLSDVSIRKTKGEGRPLHPEADRARILGALEMVDYVLIADTEAIEGIVATLLPEVVVRGKGWTHCRQSREVIERHGGRVMAAPVRDGASSTEILAQMRKYGEEVK